MPRARGAGRGRRGADGRGARGRGRAAPDPAGVPRAPRAAVRVLHAGDAARRQGAARRDARPERGRDPRAPRRQRLPLHGLRRHRRGGAPGGAGARRGRRDDGPLRRRARAARRGSPLPGGPAASTSTTSSPGDAARRLPAQPATPTRGSSRSTASRARALDGVALVVTGEDLRDLPPFTTTIATRPEAKTGTRRMLPIDRVRFVGEAVAAVVARSRAIAEDAAELIDVEYEPLPAVVDAEAALAPGAPVLHDELGDNNFAHIEFEAGDVDAAFAARRARLPQALPLRPLPRGAARGPRRDRRLGRRPRARSRSGRRRRCRSSCAACSRRSSGSPDTRVRVICPAVGGGFGLKVQLFVEEAIVPELSRRLGTPVKWVEDRYEALAASGHAKEVVCELALATDADGRFLALQGHYVGDGGAYLAHPWTSLIDPLCAASFLPGHLRRPERPLRGRHAVHEQVPVDGVPRRRLDAGPGGARGADRRRRARARHRPRRAAAAQHHPGRRPLPLGDGLQLRRRQLRRVAPPRAWS